MASSFVAADGQLVGWYEDLSHDELATLQVQLPFLSGPIDAAGAAGFRLSEVSLHSWDVFGAFDPAATLAPDAAALLVDRLPMMVSFLGRFTPRDTPAGHDDQSDDVRPRASLRTRGRRQRRPPASGGAAASSRSRPRRCSGLPPGGLHPDARPAPRSPAPSRFTSAFPATDTPAHRCATRGSTSRSSSMKMVKGSSAAVAASDPSNLGTSTKPKARYIAWAVVMNRGLEPDGRSACASALASCTRRRRIARPTPSPWAGTDVHPLDLSGRVVNGLERAHADRVAVEAGHEQPPARAEQQGLAGASWWRAVLGERDADVLLEAP